MQPLVGAVMDLSWDGRTEAGVRLYRMVDFQWGLSLLAGIAVLGALATWWVKETRCRNIWQSRP